jgi:hypothetical protein
MPKETPQPFEFGAETIPAELISQLRGWLSRGEFTTLRTVIAAKCKLAEQEAIQGCYNSQDSLNFQLFSQEAMQRAVRYRTCLSVLDEIAEQGSNLHTIKLKR